MIPYLQLCQIVMFYAGLPNYAHRHTNKRVYKLKFKLARNMVASIQESAILLFYFQRMKKMLLDTKKKTVAELLVSMLLHRIVFFFVLFY